MVLRCDRVHDDTSPFALRSPVSLTPRLAATVHRSQRAFTGLAVTAAALLVPGGLLALLPDLHWLSRLLIAVGLCVFAIAAGFAALRGDVSTRFERSRQVSLAGRVVLFVIGGLALVGGIDELLPDPYRSSSALIVIAAAIGLLLVGFLVANRRIE